MAKPVTTSARVGLANFIRANTDVLVHDWVDFARTRMPASEGMTHLALQDHILELLSFIADDLGSAQTAQQQVEKSRGLGDGMGAFRRSAAEIHAGLRLSDGFDIGQMVSEYRALRASVLKHWATANTLTSHSDLEDITRFNEAIDQVIAESVAEYTKMINQSRDTFLAVLGHDLRNPISGALMAARRMTTSNADLSHMQMMAGQIALTMERATAILDDLLELTRSALGSEMPLRVSTMDMNTLGEQIVEEICAQHEDRQILVIASGDTKGEWDRSRLGQALSNLVGNALQYSPAASTVTVRISGEGATVLLSVHNYGKPIAPAEQKRIFRPLTRGVGRVTDFSSSNLGLGLYIANKIAQAHRGTILVRSSLEEGTTFTMVLPRTQADSGEALKLGVVSEGHLPTAPRES
jgi:signal transduction histidine kinase